MVDRCFEFLKGYRCSDGYLEHMKVGGLYERSLVGTKIRWQDVIKLREQGWEGLPPPPVFTARGSRQTGAVREDPMHAPVATSLGLPNLDIEPPISRPPPLETIAAPEAETISGTPIPQSPSISIASLSDFTIADASDDEPPIDPMIITPHDTFNFEDGNVEVLCGNTLYRVHTSILSLHSPALHQMFTRTNLAAAESPNGCPRVVSSDTATDFATLLKVIYLPGYVQSPPYLCIISLTVSLQIP